MKCPHCNIEMQSIDTETSRGQWWHITGEQELHSETFRCDMCHHEEIIEYPHETII